jgi:hypothetical protein
VTITKHSHFDAKQLSTNFHETFLLDMNAISSILKVSAEGISATKEIISEITGIPTGKITGKVEPMIRYAYAMGLLKITVVKKKWSLEQTALGKIIYREDPSFVEPVTMWIMHLMLCRRLSREGEGKGVIDAWFLLFALSDIRLGKKFSLDDYITYLGEKLGASASINKLASIVIRTYTKPSLCFGELKILDENEGLIHRKSAPQYSEYYPAYTAALFLELDELRISEQQIVLDDFFDKTGFLKVLGWSNGQTLDWINWMVDNNVIQLDGQTGQSIALKLKTTEHVLAELYSESA